MKIYTRTGDTGDTSLFGGDRVKKDHARVTAYGTIDEANAAIGLAHAAPGMSAAIRALLEQVMSDLFDVGAELATPHDSEEMLRKRLPVPIDQARINALEHAIDDVDTVVPPLTTFILPAGSEGAARLHIARTVLRRAERDVVSLSQTTFVRAELIAYVNRLSDALFALARRANHDAGVADVAWKKRQ
jgi:cob(I)alamin adenosyltransferase